MTPDLGPLGILGFIAASWNPFPPVSPPPPPPTWKSGSSARISEIEGGGGGLGSGSLFRIIEFQWNLSLCVGTRSWKPLKLKTALENLRDLAGPSVPESGGGGGVPGVLPSISYIRVLGFNHSCEGMRRYPHHAVQSCCCLDRNKKGITTKCRCVVNAAMPLCCSTSDCSCWVDLSCRDIRMKPIQSSL